MTNESGTAPRLLIVEDDPAMRELLAARYRNGGFDVTEASCAREALLPRVQGGEYDLVLTDVHLPGGSGIDLARSLHLTAPSVPVVFVSGDGDVDVIREALNTQSSAAYMIKPFAMSELDAVVDLVLRHARAFTTPNYDEMEARLAEVAPVAPARFKNRIAHLVGATDEAAPTIPASALNGRSQTRTATTARTATTRIDDSPRRSTITMRQIVLLTILAAIVIIVTMVLSSQGSALQPVSVTGMPDALSAGAVAVVSATAGAPRT